MLAKINSVYEKKNVSKWFCDFVIFCAVVFWCTQTYAKIDYVDTISGINLSGEKWFKKWIPFRLKRYTLKTGIVIGVIDFGTSILTEM